MAECRWLAHHSPWGFCAEHNRIPALCSVGKAELEVRLRGDIESLGQDVIRLESRLREVEAQLDRTDRAGRTLLAERERDQVRLQQMDVIVDRARAFLSASDSYFYRKELHIALNQAQEEST